MRALFLAAALLFSAAPVFAEPWQEFKGDHFIVYYKSDEAFARLLSHNSEKYYARIADELGYPRYSNFWQWENRARIYVYPTREDFMKETGEQAWSHGMASYHDKKIHLFRQEEDIMQSILPHEITHLIFRDFVGFEGQVPLWLDEGVAQWQEPAKRALAFRIARYLIQSDKDYPIQDLMTTDIRTVSDEEKVNAYYMQSVTLVDFLVKTYGSRGFTDFCRQLRDGKKFDAALKSAYPGSIETVFDLDRRWRSYVSAATPAELEVYS